MSQIRIIEQYRIIDTENRNLISIVDTENRNLTMENNNIIGFNGLMQIINLSRDLIGHIEKNHKMTNLMKKILK
jgi:hypothetical protein